MLTNQIKKLLESNTEENNTLALTIIKNKINSENVIPLFCIMVKTQLLDTSGETRELFRNEFKDSFDIDYSKLTPTTLFSYVTKNKINVESLDSALELYIDYCNEMRDLALKVIYKEDELEDETIHPF